MANLGKGEVKTKASPTHNLELIGAVTLHLQLCQVTREREVEGDINGGNCKC